MQTWRASWTSINHRSKEGKPKQSGRQTPTNKPGNEGRDMSLLTPQERAFLDDFLHEATTSPFTGPATQALHHIGVEYSDLPDLAWAYNQEVPRTSLAWGHAAAVPPPLPWPNRESVCRRNKEMQCLWEQNQNPVGTPKAP
jgi:hypothetical protein